MFPMNYRNDTATNRRTQGYVPGLDFRRDLNRGQVGENLWADAISGSAEVKTDYKAAQTGNVFVEYACRSRRDGKYHYSGIVAAVIDGKADYWVIVLPRTGACLAIPTVKMLTLTSKYKQLGYTRECIVSGNPTKGVVIPIEQLIRDLNEGD